MILGTGTNGAILFIAPRAGAYICSSGPGRPGSCAALAFTGGDQYRIARAKEELNELQNKMLAGQYDQPELDEVIATLQRVVADNRLTPRDREILTDDLNRMREYREHHEDWR